MENEIKKLIDKYDDKTTEEPAGYFQWIEILEDLKSLLKLYQAQCELPEPKMPTIGENIKAVYERFKHLDMLLSDIVIMNEDNDPLHATCYELWKAVKNAQNV